MIVKPGKTNPRHIVYGAPFGGCAAACSMSDLFHERIPDDFVRDAFDFMDNAQHHHFMVLTKRSQRLRDLGRREQARQRFSAGRQNLGRGAGLTRQSFLGTTTKAIGGR